VLILHLLNLDLSYYITIIVYYANRQQNTYLCKYNFAILHALLIGIDVEKKY